MRISAALLVLAAVPSSAQSSPASLPVPLVTALFSGGRPISPRATFTVGALPAGWPAELTLPGARAVGGVTDGRMLLAVFADTSRRPLTTFLNRLHDAGFSQPPQRAGSGFMSSSGPFSSYCRDSTVVSAAMAPSPPGQSYLRVTYTSGSRVSCAGTDAAPVLSPATLTLPELSPPAGLRAGVAGGGTSEGSATSYGTLNGTSVAPAAMVAHYARLLTAAGWTAGAVASDSSSAAQVFRARDASGRPWEGVLTVFATATGRNVSLAMQPEERR